MRERIWTELTQAKFNVEFAALYTDQQRSILRYFNIGVLVFSTGGVMGWRIWNEAPVTACIVIASVSMLRLVQPHIIMTDKQILNLDIINKFYFNYYNKLEKLWYDFEHGSIDEESAKNIFFDIKYSETEINMTINDTIRTKPKRLVKQASSYSNQYFNQLFNTPKQ